MRDTRKPSSAVKGRAVINETDCVFQLIGSARTASTSSGSFSTRSRGALVEVDAVAFIET
jgi:hypothetical protein